MISKSHDLTLIVGARPNFVKVAPLISILRESQLTFRLINTGQHYDSQLTTRIWDDLGMDAPHESLDIPGGEFSLSGAHERLVSELSGLRPRLTVLFGDVTSTLSGALASAHCDIPMVHVEAGLRSGESSLPEEINRVLVDRLSSLLLCTTHDAATNLFFEGRSKSEIGVPGNLMIDSLVQHLREAIEMGTSSELGLETGNFALLTIHRNAVRKNECMLAEIVETMNDLNSNLPVILPLHPSMRVSIENCPAKAHFKIIPAQGYKQFLNLLHSCRIVITDSGGVQEEATFLNKPCVTARTCTERPITVTHGSNLIGGVDKPGLLLAIEKQLEKPKVAIPIPMWDGQAAPRVRDEIISFLDRFPC